MTSVRADELGFAPAHDAPIPYIERIRDYYVTLGYGAPYEWAHYASVPFSRLATPLPALRQAAAAGRIGALAARFHGLPTNRSHRTTIDVDCREIVDRCKADGADAAIVVPNCPVCHQSAALAARALEASGIATVVM